MHRSLRQPLTAAVSTVPRSQRQKSLRRMSGDGGPNATIDRVTCSVCGFHGINITTSVGENFPTAYVTTGNTYVWTTPDQPLSVIDLQVLPVPNTSVSCPFCGATRWTDGAKGQGQ